MPHDAFYFGEQWRSMRAAYLRANRYCRVCLLLGIRELATEVDHVRAIARGGPALDPRNLQALCKMHHSQKTRAEERGQRLTITSATGAPVGSQGWGGDAVAEGSARQPSLDPRSFGLGKRH